MKTQLRTLAAALVASGEVPVPLVRDYAGRFKPALFGWADGPIDPDDEIWSRVTGLGIVDTGRLVIDIDTKNGASTDIVGILGVSNAPQFGTPHGGLHVHLRLPPGTESRSVQSWGKAIDLISGSRAWSPVWADGYAPQNGLSLRGLIRDALPPAPAEIVPAVRGGSRSRRGLGLVNTAGWSELKTIRHTSNGAWDTLMQHCAQVRAASPGTQATTLNRLAYASGRAVCRRCLGAETAEHQLVLAGMKMVNGDQEWPWTEAEIRRIVQAAMIDGWNAQKDA